MCWKVVSSRILDIFRLRSIYAISITGFTITVLAYSGFLESETGRTHEQMAIDTTEPLWLRDSHPMYPLPQSTLRCSAEDLGLFSLVRKPEVEYKNVQKSQCLFECFKRGVTFAGVTKENNCYCTSTLKDYINSKTLNIAASIARANRNQWPATIRIFKKSFGCLTEFSEVSNDTKIGCINAPIQLRGAMKSWTMEGMNPQQCILQCERHQYVVALPIVEFNACICSDLLSMFISANNMYSRMRGCGKIYSEKAYAVYRTFAVDKNCGPKTFIPANRSNHRLITSLPGSGNTWLRQLIETATGIYTGSVYNDGNLFNGGLLGELMPVTSDTTIAIKDHLFKFKISDTYTSAISLIRNVHNSALADFARFKTRSHTDTIDQSLYAGEEFRRFASWRPKTWVKTQRYLLGNISSVLVVYFEDLQVDPVGQMRRILNFLPKRESDTKEAIEARLMCMNLDLTGSFKRPTRHLDFNPFENISKIYDDCIREMDEIMKQYKQPPVPSSYFNYNK